MCLFSEAANRESLRNPFLPASLGREDTMSSTVHVAAWEEGVQGEHMRDSARTKGSIRSWS